MKFRKFRYFLFALCLISSLAALSLARLENAGNVRKTSGGRHHGRSMWPLPSRPRRSNIDHLYSNEEDEDMIEIDPEEQERKLNEASLNCTLRMRAALLNPDHTSWVLKSNNSCPIVWDNIICWPSIAAGAKHSVPCPNYVNKFNRRKKAVKYCVYNSTLKIADWTRTNFTPCLLPSEHIIKDMNEIKILEHHLKYIAAIRLCGYIVSMVSLIFSILILLRPKMRCPRNNIHVNLFVTFCLRTVSIMIVDILRQKTDIFKISTNTSDTEVDHDPKYRTCRSIIMVFRYSGSVYHAAITTEAVYLMLLLRFPYYSEKKGSKFSIITSWILPLLWLFPWLMIRLFVESQWCWQVESLWNLLIEIPHTILTIANVTAAVYIICTLYSKMQSHELNPEKVIKYRRLAKSILILVPIFGLHFIFFEWLPYLRAIGNDETLLEMPFMYLEALFNSFQGVMASIACCFIHLEARIEVLVMIRRVLKRLKLLNTFERIKCLTPEYITKLRRSRENNHTTSRNRSASCAPNPGAGGARSVAGDSFSIAAARATPLPRSYSQSLIRHSIARDTYSPHTTANSLLHASNAGGLEAIGNPNESLLGTKITPSRTVKDSGPHMHNNHHPNASIKSWSSSSQQQQQHRRRRNSIDSNVSFRNICCCLFTNQKNDFYTAANGSSRRKSLHHNGSTSSFESMLARKKKSSGRRSNSNKTNGSVHMTPLMTTTTMTNEDEVRNSSRLSRLIDQTTGRLINSNNSNGSTRRGWSYNRRRIEMIKRANTNSLKIYELNNSKPLVETSIPTTAATTTMGNGHKPSEKNTGESGGTRNNSNSANGGLEVRFLSNSLGEIITSCAKRQSESSSDKSGDVIFVTVVDDKNTKYCSPPTTNREEPPPSYNNNNDNHNVNDENNNNNNINNETDKEDNNNNNNNNTINIIDVLDNPIIIAVEQSKEEDGNQKDRPR